MTLRLTSSLTALALVVTAASAQGQELEGETGETGKTLDDGAAASKRAREAFVEGTELARKAQWAKALAAFERASAIKPHAVTTYNIGTCHRAIGAYAKAFLTFRQALAEHESRGELPAELVGQSQTFLAEIDQLLVTIDLTVVPTGATLAVDGRPLLADREAWFAGVRAPGAGEPLNESAIELRLDPGAHVFSFERAGFETALVNETFAPGTKRSLRIELDTLPGRLRVDATVPGALVSLDGREVGPTPLELARPAGAYEILVEKEGYEPHRADIALSPGQEVTIRAPLAEETTSIVEAWWFWTAAGVVIAGGVTATYFLTRPEPAPAPYDGGSLDWVVTPESVIRF